MINKSVVNIAQPSLTNDGCAYKIDLTAKIQNIFDVSKRLKLFLKISFWIFVNARRYSIKRQIHYDQRTEIAANIPGPEQRRTRLSPGVIR